MGHKNKRNAYLALQFAQFQLHLFAQLLVERAQRFIQQKHLGPQDQGTGQGDPLAVAPQPGAPQGADPTIYYLSFVLASGDPNVINNHIPLDPPAGNFEVRLVKTSDRRTATIGDLVPYTITAENIGVQPITNLTISDNLPPGFSFVQGSARLVGDGALTQSHLRRRADRTPRAKAPPSRPACT